MTEPDDRRSADRLASHIDDVVLRRLTSYRDDRGTLTELLRNSWDLGLPPAQWNIVASKASVLRGVHVHRTHVDYVTVVAGETLMLLHDMRDGSPTHRRTEMLRLCAGDLHMVVIPPGVAHGFYFPAPACLLQAVTHEFDESDEFGCRWDAPELNADWPCREPILSGRDTAAVTYDDLRLQLGRRV